MELSGEVEELVEKLTNLGTIKPISEFTVVWDDLNESTQVEKLEQAEKMSVINDKATSTGAPIFDDNEIRTAAGYEPASQGKPLPDEDPD